MTRIVVSLAGRDVDEIVDVLPKALDVADIVEIRLDHLERMEDMSSIEDYLDCRRTMFTFRSGSEGGAGGELGMRELDVLEGLVEACPNSLIDVEMEKIRGIPRARRLAEELGGRLIASKHVAKPRLEDLVSEYRWAEELGGYVKIVCNAERIEDNVVPLELYAMFGPSKLISFCTGKAGILSRVLSAALGAPLAYASQPYGEPVASGQLPAPSMRALIDAVREALKVNP